MKKNPLLLILTLCLACSVSEKKEEPLVLKNEVAAKQDDTLSSQTDSNELVLQDVHGAGAQRSSPKTGNPEDYPSGGHGPQGDVISVYNYVRCVRTFDNPGEHYQIVDTGQNVCYDDGTVGKLSQCPARDEKFYGQDAQYSRNLPAYTNNSEDTIIDNVTGLTWQKKIKKISWHDASSDAAKDQTGGFNDWRVPTIKELYSLIQFSGSTGTASPDSSLAPEDAVAYIDTTFFDFEYPRTGRYIDAQYVSSTKYVSQVTVNVAKGAEECFFGVNFADGRIKCYPLTGNHSDSTYYVRYVRGNTVYGKNIFSVNPDGTINDLATGLTWMSADSGDLAFKENLAGFTLLSGAMNWYEALHFCENLIIGGKSDWRLPNAKELHSLVDYNRSPATTDSPSIDPVFESTQIKDLDGNRDFPFFWTSTTHLDGKITGQFAVYIAFGEAEGLVSAKANPIELPGSP